MKFPPELLQKIKDAVSLIEVIGEHVVLRKSGSNHSGLCPFHSERTPSFSVSEQKQLYHCYGCKRGGDLFRFVMDMHGLSFPEAVEDLAERGRVKLPAGLGRDGEASGDPAERQRREAARERAAVATKLNRFAAKYFHEQLARWPEATAYVKARGVSEELIRSFYVGAAPAGWDGLSKHLEAAKAPLPVAVDLGLIRPSTRNAPGGSGYFDLFRGRIIFPIIDLRGKVVGFGGREFGKSDGPKYLNSNESFLFHKSKLAFGLFQAQKHIREKDELILVEGYFDVLALHAAGFQNVVATCGTSLTPDHLALFRRFASRITILFDGDKAGVAATERAMLVGLEKGLVLYGAEMPEGLDPDELLFDQQTGLPTPRGRERMMSILENARPILDRRIEDAVQFAALGPENQVQALKRVGGWLAQFQDPVGREVRMGAVCKQLGITRDLLRQAMGTGGAGAAPAAAPAVKVARGATQAVRLTRRDKTLLAAVARGGEAALQVAQIGGDLPPGWTHAELFDSAAARALVADLIGKFGDISKIGPLSSEYLEPSLEYQVRSTIVEALMASEAPVGSEDLRRAIELSVARCWARFSQSIKDQIAAAEAKQDAELHQKLLKEYLDVQRKMKEFSTFYDEA